MTISLLPSGSLVAVFLILKLHQIDVKIFFLTVKLSKRLSMGKNPMDYNKLRELGMKVLTVFLQSLGFTKSFIFI
jgi:hypothetical protein